jgi:hypothetical protein
MEPMELVLESLKLLKLGEKPNYTWVAKEYGVEHSMLSCYHQGVQGTQAEKWENQSLLNNTQEKELVLYIDRFC